MPNSNSRRAILGGLLSLAPMTAGAQIQLPREASDFLNRKMGGAGPVPAGASLSQNQIGAGLKDAMKVASRNVIGQVGKPNGFFGDHAIRIPLPGALERIAQPLRSVGASGMLDDLVLRMNRGAEQAAPRALNIFVDAASGMSFDDARGILTGPQDSVTRYFERTCAGPLTTSFTPIVRSSLNGAGAMRALDAVQTRAGKIPLIAQGMNLGQGLGLGQGFGQGLGNFDLVTFTVGKAMEGLFHYLAVEEREIRTDPVARSTNLLRSIFG
jgi:hypothetical protein